MIMATMSKTARMGKQGFPSLLHVHVRTPPLLMCRSNHQGEENPDSFFLLGLIVPSAALPPNKQNSSNALRRAGSKGSAA